MGPLCQGRTSGSAGSHPARAGRGCRSSAGKEQPQRCSQVEMAGT